MAYNPPTYGESGEVYTDNVRNSLDAVRTTADEALAKASSNDTSLAATAQTADEAKEIAEAAKAFVEAPTDGRVAALVDDPASSTTAALSAAFAGKSARGQIAPWATTRRGGPPAVVPIITGSDEETPGTFSRVGFNFPVLETTNTKINGRAWAFTGNGATTSPTLTFTIPGGPITLANPAQTLCMWVHLSDLTNVTSLNVSLFQDAGKTIVLNRGTAGGDYHPQPLQVGWNFLRFSLGPVWTSAWTGESVSAFYLRLNTTAGVTTTIIPAHVYLECAPKARMVFGLDRGYRSFILNGGLARMRELGVPITWNIDVTKMGGAVGTGAEAITLAEVREMWEAGDSVSFHGYTGDATATMTDAQLREDTMRSIKYLASQGYEGRLWRGAWVQNDSPNPGAVKGLLLGQAQSNPSSPVVWPQAAMMECWPPLDMHNIRRWVVQGASRPGDAGGNPTFVDEVFSALKATHGTIFPYFHGILGPDGSTGAQAGTPGNDATLAQWNYFADKVEAAIDEGWLEPTTFEALWFESGGSFSTIGGGTVATWTDPDGTARTKHLP